jgi:hypothetical protein
MSIAQPNLKSLEFKDITDGGKDPYGRSAALLFGVAAGAAGGVLTADKMTAPTAEARLLVGGAVGGLVGGLVAGGCSGSDSKLCLAGLVLGGLAGIFGGHPRGSVDFL